ncbi:MAG: zf-HC2 domain-containing protein [Myxococcota bacterium]|nr:zf-HC2 domain-containing protein [Myxococcota bacterium]
MTELASQHVDRDLPIAKRMAIRMHVMMCAHCRRFIRQLRATLELLRTLGDPREPAAVDDALLAAFRARRR